MRRLFLGIMALALALISARGAVADQRVPEWHLSDAPDGGAVTEFGSGIRSIFVVFRYQDAAATKIRIVLHDTGGVTIFDRANEYTGSGQEVWEVTGQMVYQTYFDQVATRGEDALQALDSALAATGPMLLVQAQAVAAEGMVIRSALSALGRYPVDLATKEALDEAVARVDAVVQAGMSLNFDTPEDEMRATVQQMKADLTAALQLAEEGRTTGGDGAGFGFLDMPEGQVNIAQLWVDDNITDSIEWTVTPSGVGAVASPTPPTATTTPAPTSTTPPTAVPSPTPRPATPTVAPGRPTATRPPAAYPGPTATTVPTVVASPTVTGPTPTQAEASPTVQEPGALEVTETPPSVIETAPPATLTEVVATPGATATAGPTRLVPRPRVTPTPASAAPGSGLPLGTVGAVAAAVLLGLVALWFRRHL